MPAGPAALGFVYFAAVKFVGYTSFCRWAIEPQFDDYEGTVPPVPSAWKAGAVRTAIGVAIGATVGLGFWASPWAANGSDSATVVFFSVLVPIRFFEWWLLLRLVYKEFKLSSRRRAALIVTGIITSFALDAIGVGAAFVIPGGMWVC